MFIATLSLVIGTHNIAKGRELADLLAPHGFRVETLQEVGDALEVVEDGDTFATNARKKSVEQAIHLKSWVLADDSGLEVDALGAAPGVYSARFGGEDASDAENNLKLLDELAGIPINQRGARYYCHVAVADPTGEIRAESSAICRGRIRCKSAGEGGFGYDPLFEIVEYHRTFGELGRRVKAALSHRARAMRAIVPQLVDLSRGGTW